jgi:hypothetical protein
MVVGGGVCESETNSKEDAEVFINQVDGAWMDESRKGR